MSIVFMTLGLLWTVVAYYGTVSSATQANSRDPASASLWIAKLCLWGIVIAHFLGAMACKAVGW